MNNQINKLNHGQQEVLLMMLRSAVISVSDLNIENNHTINIWHHMFTFKFLLKEHSLTRLTFNISIAAWEDTGHAKRNCLSYIVTWDMSVYQQKAQNHWHTIHLKILSQLCSRRIVDIFSALQTELISHISVSPHHKALQQLDQWVVFTVWGNHIQLARFKTSLGKLLLPLYFLNFLLTTINCAKKVLCIKN